MSHQNSGVEVEAEWSVQQIAEQAGVSSRTLRHYHHIGLLLPDRIGENGYRYYGPASVARLQRILLLREIGMPLAEIKTVLDAERSAEAEIAALHAQLERLRSERNVLERRIRAVEETMKQRKKGAHPQMDVMLDGFNEKYKAEVVERWGQSAYRSSNDWWRAKSAEEKRVWKERADEIMSEWNRLLEAGERPGSSAAQQHAQVHVDWFGTVPGTPGHAAPGQRVDSEKVRAMVRGLADLYEASPDFQAAFGGLPPTRFAAEALRFWAKGNRTWSG